jgi:hypothetical protein
VVLNRHERIEASATGLLMESPRSRAYVLGIAPLRMSVRWTMWLDDRALTGRLEVNFGRPPLTHRS